MVNEEMKRRKFLFLIVALLFCCGVFSGCATLGMAACGLTSLLGTVISLPFQLLFKALDVVKTMPMPPPGVFF